MAREAEDLAAQAERLRQLKKQARGVTFAHIAAAVGRTERQVQRWFAGDSDIDPGVLPKLATYLGTTADFIEYGTVKPPRSSPAPDLIETLSDPAKLLEQLEAIKELIQAEAAMNAARVAEVMQLLEDRLPPSGESRRRRPA